MVGASESGSYLKKSTNPANPSNPLNPSKHFPTTLRNPARESGEVDGFEEADLIDSPLQGMALVTEARFLLVGHLLAVTAFYREENEALTTHFPEHLVATVG